MSRFRRRIVDKNGLVERDRTNVRGERRLVQNRDRGGLVFLPTLLVGPSGGFKVTPAAVLKLRVTGRDSPTTGESVSEG